MTRRNKIIIGVAVALLVGYVVSYYSMVERDNKVLAGWMLSFEDYTIEFPPTYLDSTDELERFYWPIHQIDRRIRSGYWVETFPGRISGVREAEEAFFF